MPYLAVIGSHSQYSVCAYVPGSRLTRGETARTAEGFMIYYIQPDLGNHRAPFEGHIR